MFSEKALFMKFSIVLLASSKVNPCRSIDLVFLFFFFLLLRSLSGYFSVLFINLFQSFLSLSEILSFNYVKILTSCQFGFADVVSREKIHVS